MRRVDSSRDVSGGSRESGPERADAGTPRATLVRVGDLWQLWLDVARQALLSLGDRRLRSGLSILGIAIGIAAVILISVVSRGGREVVDSELQTFGLRSVWIYRDRTMTDPRRIVRAGTGIDNDDYQAIVQSGCCDALARITPVVYAGQGLSNVIRSGRRYSQVRIEGVGADYMEINNDSISVGRGFIPGDFERRRKVVVIGERVRADLFGDQIDPLGQEIQLGDLKFEVVGVLARKDRTLLSSIGSAGGQDTNSRLLVPYGRVQALNGGTAIDMLQGALASDKERAGVATSQVTSLLKRRHRDDYDYHAETMEQYIGTANAILGGVSKIGIIAASVSLLVAGLGILNIMSTSVLERTREIGLRKAIGGSDGAILTQFLLEAGFISLLGGVAGVTLGLLSSVLIVKLTGFPLAPSISMIVLALVISAFVGVVSGFYPAYRAAKLRPVEALRYE
jgi:ABC-type antimicrobial peptide transport system permease subunit